MVHVGSSDASRSLYEGFTGDLPGLWCWKQGFLLLQTWEYLEVICSHRYTYNYSREKGYHNDAADQLHRLWCHLVYPRTSREFCTAQGKAPSVQSLEGGIEHQQPTSSLLNTWQTTKVPQSYNLRQLMSSAKAAIRYKTSRSYEAKLAAKSNGEGSEATIVILASAVSSFIACLTLFSRLDARWV